MHLSGLAEAGLISSKLSRRDMLSSVDEDQGPFFFSPERYLQISVDTYVLVELLFPCYVFSLCD